MRGQGLFLDAANRQHQAAQLISPVIATQSSVLLVNSDTKPVSFDALDVVLNSDHDDCNVWRLWASSMWPQA